MILHKYICNKVLCECTSCHVIFFQKYTKKSDLLYLRIYWVLLSPLSARKQSAFSLMEAVFVDWTGKLLLRVVPSQSESGVEREEATFLCSVLILVTSELLAPVVSLQLPLSSVSWSGRLLMHVSPLLSPAAMRWSGLSLVWVISGKTTPWLARNCANQHGDVTSVVPSTCTPKMK